MFKNTANDLVFYTESGISNFVSTVLDDIVIELRFSDALVGEDRWVETYIGRYCP